MIRTEKAMTIEDIREIISSDENRTLELKKTTGELKDGMHSACAFLNTAGGLLFFGIAPTSLKILGQQVTDNTLKEIAQAIKGLEPAIDVPIKYIEVPDRPGNFVIAMHFDGWKWGDTQYTFHGTPYYRVESTTSVMPRSLFDERLRASAPKEYAWINQPSKDLTVEDLNHDFIRGMLRLGVEKNRISEASLTEPIEDILAKLELLKDGKPTNAAAMLFAKDTSNYHQFRVRLARFRGTDKNEFIDNQQASGNFLQLLDAGMSFFFKHLSLSGKITNKLQREEELEIPAGALREAYINALCHCMWERDNVTIGIAIYDDRVEIENPGIFKDPINPESIKSAHPSIPYNPTIAEVLFRSGYLENWGSGAKRIIDLCKEHGIPEPIWVDNHGFISICFFKSNKAYAQNVLKDVLKELTDRQRVIIDNVLKDANVTIAQLAENLDVDERTIRRDITTLQKSGILHREGGRKDGQWVISIIP